MLPGPVFTMELITTARRSRFFVLRTLYGLILLVVFWQNYELTFRWSRQREVSVRELAQFAESIFASLAITQIVAVLVVTPALLAGVIADEKQRKTLHYLLASRLSSGEIVLGKLAARGLHVGVFLAVSLPITSLLALMGGIPPQLIAYLYAISGSTALFLAGLSLLVSTYARRVRDAVIAVYVVELLWLLFPIASGLLEEIAPSAAASLAPVFERLGSTNPFLIPGLLAPRAGAGSPTAEVALMAGLHLGMAAVFVGLSIWRLRPVYQSQSGDAPRGRLRSVISGRPWRLLSRRPIGDDAILWKELNVARPGGLVRWVVRIGTFLGLALLGYYYVTLGGDALVELIHDGYQFDRGQNDRMAFNFFLRTSTVLIYLVWGVGVAFAAASSITSEREEDTWISLISTSLDGNEIIRAKLLGSIWNLRLLGFVILGLWVSGLIVGSVHPVGLILEVIEWVAYTAFIAALGLTFSLHSRNTIRACAATIGLLVLFNGGYMMCCIPVASDTALFTVGFTPLFVGLSLFSFQEVGELLEGRNSWGPARAIPELFVAGFISVLLYGGAAIVLIRRACLRFDQAVDRPRRDEVTWLEPVTTVAGPQEKASDMEEL